MASETEIDTVVFDYGGVLTTAGRTAIAAWTSAEGIRPETFSAALKEWLSRDAEPGTPIHRLETGEMTVEEFDRVLAERLRKVDGGAVAPEGLLARLMSFMEPQPEMFELLEQVRLRGARTALLSNSWGNAYPWDRLDGLFDATVISSQVGLRKPDPRIYRLVLDKLGVPARRAVLVDDGAPNIEAAHHLGMHTVLHREPRQTRAALDELVPEAVIADPQESP